jgi:hypothetical protein
MQEHTTANPDGPCIREEGETASQVCSQPSTCTVRYNHTNTETQREVGGGKRERERERERMLCFHISFCKVASCWGLLVNSVGSGRQSKPVTSLPCLLGIPLSSHYKSSLSVSAPWLINLQPDILASKRPALSSRTLSPHPQAWPLLESRHLLRMQLVVSVTGD